MASEQQTLVRGQLVRIDRRPTRQEFNDWNAGGMDSTVGLIGRCCEGTASDQQDRLLIDLGFDSWWYPTCVLTPISEVAIPDEEWARMKAAR